ncbi:MAG: hypothetical protein KDA52_16195, partial [Planctomycetaceae bacterium]|nr:hypothetical protein [Planctomycetaceae bacterium]
MKTCRYNLKACTLLAALSTMTLVGRANAEDAGVVRLGAAPGAASVSDEGHVVIRGQSDLRRRNAQTSRALLRLISAYDEPATASVCDDIGCDSYESCDGCAACPVTTVPVCAAPVCAAPVCAAPVCAAPTCETACAAPTALGCDTCVPSCADYDSCAPIDNACDGCAPFLSADDCDGACSYCDGSGCHYCDGDGVGVATVGGGLFNRVTDYPYGYSGTGCSVCDTRAVVNRNCVSSFLGQQAAMHRARKRIANQNLNAYLRCKLGYFIPDGCGGAGCQLFGH